ncbi:ankyrin repeat domain-containing protein [Sulfurimonas xiamenensis]|nr:ankyrin repeat domain-containing protein [Sulfurimonas xiamenensis]
MKLEHKQNRKFSSLTSILFGLLFISALFGASDYSVPGEMPLMSAVRQNQLEKVKTLIANGADVNMKKAGAIEVTPLMVAARYGHTEIMEILIENGADVNVKSDEGYTALMRAARNGKTDAVKILLLNHADVNARNFGGMSALKFAAGCYPDIVQILLDNGADQGDLANTPMKRADCGPKIRLDFLLIIPALILIGIFSLITLKRTVFRHKSSQAEEHE